MSYFDLQLLNNELNCDCFEQQTFKLDHVKVIDALKLLTEKITELETKNISCELLIEDLSQKINNQKTILKLISKDYPEIVLSHTQLFEE